MSLADLCAMFGLSRLFTHPLASIRAMAPSAVPDQRGRMWLRMCES
ncbi:hypothetical protein SAMN04487818_106101 [Actinokineospora terrae]|uniref:Uncharacterized protein n=1 Tax=Actinokineospora terrae TaxID=155974 RepID=A0A1H9T852_9PSEU|nr:hypothetical protein SAMN04487818_106101 [Actinokineospora terrae]